MKIACFSQYSPFRRNTVNRWIGGLYSGIEELNTKINVDFFHIAWGENAKIIVNHINSYIRDVEIILPRFSRLFKSTIAQPITTKLFKNSGFQTKEYDLLHANTLFYAFALRFFNDHTLKILHIHENSKLLRKIVTMKRYNALQYISDFDYLIRPSSVDVEYLKKLNENIIVIPNSINCRIFTYHNIEKPSIKNLRIISVGSLRKIKNYPLALLTIKELKERGFNVLYNIIGEGPEKKKILSIIKKLNLQDSVVLHGRLSQNEVAEVLCNSHLFLNTSLTESFGISLLEALAIGRPVIVCASGGPEYIFNWFSNKGLKIGTFTKQNHVSLANAIEDNLKNNYDMRAVSNIVHKEFSSKRFLERLIKLRKPHK